MDEDEKDFEEWYQQQHPEPYYQDSRPDQVLQHARWEQNKQYRKEGFLAARQTLRKKIRNAPRSSFYDDGGPSFE